MIYSQLLDQINSETDTSVKLIDVYREFNESIAEKLRIPAFRSRKVTRKYSFDPNIPTQSDYLEVRYSVSRKSSSIQADMSIPNQYYYSSVKMSSIFYIFLMVVLYLFLRI